MATLGLQIVGDTKQDSWWYELVQGSSARWHAVPTLSRELLDALVQTSFTVMAMLEPVAAEHDLSLTQLALLAILRDREPTMAELAGYLGLDRSSVSGLVDRAEKRGLVAAHRE